jgi:chromosome segregation ATPase
MRLRMRVVAGIIAATLLALLVPSAVFAQGPAGSLAGCVEIADGDKEAFLECVEGFKVELQEQYDLPEGWFEGLVAFVEEHPDWAQKMRFIADRLENRWDRWEDRRDGREDTRARIEDYRDRAEDLRDRWEDRQDGEFDLEDLFDRLEDRRDKKEDRWDRRENRFDRRENYRDRFEDWHDRRQPA